MAQYCRFWEDRSTLTETNYVCTSNEDNPRGITKDDYIFCCCNRNSAYANCEYYNHDAPKDKDGFNVTTAACMKAASMQIGERNGIIYNSLIDLKHDELLAKKAYYLFMKIYSGSNGEPAIGAKLAGKIIPDEPGELKRKDRYRDIDTLYSKLEEIAVLANSGETAEEKATAKELAAHSYIMLVLRLISSYGLQKDYRDYRRENTGYRQKAFAKTYTLNVKKNKEKIEKTLD